ncbi:MAG: class I SAM-dependent methyltransferase [Candidatus Thermoplasmatota archaeon]|nr:class I SAM-dependent methyltransferase [Candidatus Thermoplasmatota archaeon]
MENNVLEVFSSISDKYDFLDSMISWGMDQRWRRAMVRKIPLGDGKMILDCGAGTGKLSSLILKRCKTCHITMVDINDRMFRKEKFPNVHFITSTVESIPVDDMTQDAVVSAFLTRNVPKLERYISETYRVLKPGGVFVNLDIFRPVLPVYREFFSLYFYHIVPFIGNRVTGSTSYTYLAQSVKRFVTTSMFSTMMGLAGFHDIEMKPFMFGSVCMHAGIK